MAIAVIAGADAPAQGLGFIEAIRMPGKQNLKMTGSLGAVMKESGEAAMSLLGDRLNDRIRSRIRRLGQLERGCQSFLDRGLLLFQRPRHCKAVTLSLQRHHKKISDD